MSPVRFLVVPLAKNGSYDPFFFLCLYLTGRAGGGFRGGLARVAGPAGCGCGGRIVLWLAYRSADDVLRRNAAGYLGRRMIRRWGGRTEVGQPAPGAGVEPRCRRRIVCAVAGPCFGRCVALQSLVRVGKWPVVIGIRLTYQVNHVSIASGWFGWERPVRIRAVFDVGGRG